MMKVTRAVVSERADKFVVSVLVRLGVDTWRDSRVAKPKTFYSRDLAIEYAKTYGEVVA